MTLSDITGTLIARHFDAKVLARQGLCRKRRGANVVWRDADGVERRLDANGLGGLLVTLEALTDE